MAILAPHSQKSSKRPWKACLRPGLPFKAWQTPSLKKKLRNGSGRRHRPRDTEGMLSRSMRSTKKKVLESFFGSYDLNAYSLIQCQSQADIRLKLTEHENESGLQSGSISWLVAGI